MATGILSSNTPTSANTGATRDNQLYRCIVVKRYFVDDELNVTQNAPNPQVLYDCAILGGFQEGQTISNCRLASWLGGQYNYAERVLRPNQKPLNEIPLKDQDGDIVLVQYIQGQNMAPMIVGMGTQPKDGDATGATIEDGPRWVEQYNGVETKIDKEGQYTLTVKGGMIDEETNSFTPAEGTSLASFSIDKDKKVLLETSEGPSLLLDGMSDKINIATTGGDMISLSGGNINIISSSGVEITLSSSGITLKSGTKLTVEADRVDLNAGEVRIGNGASFKATVFENLKSAFEGHIHQVPQAMAGILPSQPPLQPLLPTVGSNTVRITD